MHSIRRDYDLSTDPPGDGGILSSDGHQMSEQGLGPEQTQTQVGGFGPVLKRLRVREVISAWAIVDQGYHNLGNEGEHKLVNCIAAHFFSFLG